jgi:hypothetical protein
MQWILCCTTVSRIKLYTSSPKPLFAVRTNSNAVCSQHQTLASVHLMLTQYPALLLLF